MTKNIFLLFLFASTLAFGQNNKLEKMAATITTEGKELYKSEMASWCGTGLFFKKFSNKEKEVKGYFSYVIDNVPKCILYSKGDTARVLGTITFDTAYNYSTAIIDSTKRDFTPVEREYYTIKNKAFVKTRTDTLIKFYENTHLHFIPIIAQGEKKVYIITAPEKTGMIVFGNDYLVTFNKHDEITKIRKLHHKIAVFDINPNDTLKITTSMLVHLKESGAYITPTDVCSLMLYEKYTPWDEHIVESDKYISIWMCKTNKLVILTIKAWLKMQNVGKKFSHNHYTSPILQN